MVFFLFFNLSLSFIKKNRKMGKELYDSIYYFLLQGVFLRCAESVLVLDEKIFY